MTLTSRLLSLTKIDDYVTQGVSCVSCQSLVDVSVSYYGRIVTGWQNVNHNGVAHVRTTGNDILVVPTVTERFFPTKVTGHICKSCYDTLHATTWRDKKNHLRRAVELVHRQVEQPRNDDHEASPITKGLYAPHGHKGSLPSALIDETREPLLKDKLQGFNRKFRSTGGKVKVVMKKGKVL